MEIAWLLIVVASQSRLVNESHLYHDACSCCVTEQTDMLMLHNNVLVLHTC